MTKSQRQHGIGSLAPDEKIVGKPGGIVEPGVKQYGIFKKIKKGIKKVFKSPIGKIGLLGLGAYGLGGAGFLGGKGIFAAGQGMQRFRNLANIGRAAKGLWPGASRGRVHSGPMQWAGSMKDKPGMLSNLWGKVGDFGYGKSALLGLGAAGMALPFLAGKPDEEEEGDSWEITPPSIANIKNMAVNRDPSLNFLPSSIYAQPGYYNMAKGGIANLANGGGAAEAQAEQMLKMEYQKYRNQGGTMSYQQFKMAVLQQAQSQGPMAPKRGRVDGPGGYAGINLADYFSIDDLDLLKSHKYDPYEVLRWRDKGKGLLSTLRLAQGGRVNYANGELVEDESMVEATPAGMMEENVEEVQGEPTREQLEALAMEIFQLRLEELDEEQLMVVYQAAMEQQPQEEMVQEDIQFNPQMAQPQMAAYGGRIQLANGGVINSHVPGYTTPPGYNQFDYPSGGVRVRRAEGGIMDLGGMEKDYRAEGGFVPIGGKEKADDVPARLSKNEFVFTADAVRNAGGGDIDAGAKVMENMMNHLESGGQISEESQGGGGEEMISEEELIEAPNGAQEMYDQQAMLQSRME